MAKLISKLVYRKLGGRADSMLQDFELELPLASGTTLRVTRKDSEITVAEERVENGMTRQQPKMKFEVAETGEWLPISLLLALTGPAEAIIYCEGKRFIDPDQLKRQVVFSEDWADYLDLNINWLSSIDKSV